MSSVFGYRIRIISIIFIFIGLLFVAKLAWLQIVHGEKYSQEADRQYVRTAHSQFDRGSIFFKKKNGELVSGASLLRGFMLTVNPSILQQQENFNPEQLYESLKNIIPELDQETLIKQVSKKNDTYEELAVKLTQDQAEQIKQLQIKSATLYQMNARFSPSGLLAPHVIGLVAYKDNDLVGRYGLERFYDDILSRVSSGLYVNFFAEVFTHLTQFSKDEIPTEGDIVTTLEPLVQSSLQNELELIREQWDSDRTTGIIMDPKTGAVVAMASTPGFDINNYRNVSSVALLNNPAVESVFEMGSIMKPIILATALDQGAITADTTYYDAGFIKVGDRTIRNFDRKGRGTITMQTVLDQSLNTGMVFAMQRMDKNNFREQFEKFGFGETTGIDLPGEIKGLVSNLRTNRDVEFANIAFGQGIAATPIGMTRAMSVLANGGKLMQPRVVEYIEYIDGTKKIIEPTILKTVIKPESSEEITRMMVNAFDSYFNGTKKLKHYSIAGKTGTAQIANRESGGYYEDRNLHTFVGYFPAYDPKFIIFLMNEYPKKGAQFSSETLVDPFLNITNFLINYYNIPPDR